MRLTELGERICILGPSNSGKSTLAVAIGSARGLKVVHLDQLYHLPATDWQPRPTAAFVGLHDAEIAGARWVVEGNYSISLPQRLARATGLILLDVSTATSLLRYLRRTWFDRERHGSLEGGTNRVRWEMVHHITVVTPRNRRRYADLFHAADLPKLHLPSARALNARYRDWGLTG